MKKKILLIGNTEIAVFGFRGELVDRLVADGYEVYTCFAQSDFGDGYTSAQKHNCTFLPINMSRHGANPFKEFALIIDLFKLISRINPDVILTFTIKPNIYGGIISAIKGIPYVANVSGLGKMFTSNTIVKLFAVCMYKVAMIRAQTVFFQNNSNEECFSKYHIRNKHHKVLPGSGVNLDKYQVLSFPSDENIGFLFMARIIREKGIDQYIDAAISIKKKYPNTKFYVIGYCDDKNYLDKLNNLTNNGTIIYEGLQSDVVPYLLKTQCTVLPTYYAEGLSNVLIESAASGRAIITTNRSGSGETVDDGKTGFYVKEQDSVDLIAKIEKFLNLSHEERKEMGLMGRKKVEKEFDRQIVVNKYMEEIENDG